MTCQGMYYPKKPDRIRVVFDGSAQFDGSSLNSQLLQGPDLMNSLLGILCRFRQEQIAVTCDVEKMFHQFQVIPQHRDYLRFVWWPQGDVEADPLTYRMKVHVFGAVSTPAYANFAMRRMAEEYREVCGDRAADFVTHNFYVDDGLKSVPTVEDAKDLVGSVRDMCKRGSLHLYKFVSNSKEVLESISKEDRAVTVRATELIHENLPIERTLGVQWCVTSDTLGFRVILQDKPLTKRSILSTISSVYDPLGFVAPVILRGKQILQKVCNESVDWDTPLMDSCRSEWEQWQHELLCLDRLKISRCFRPEGFETKCKIQLHHFSDASDKGYAQCSYIRMINKKGEVHCAFVMGKSRVTPRKQITVPRLELTAAVISAKVAAILRRELDYEIEEETFWSDSTVVLGYIANKARRFHVYVANRVQQIHDLTSPDQWKHVKSAENPADEGSRGLAAQELSSDSRWLVGPAFLWKRELPHTTDIPSLPAEDPEIRFHVMSTTTDSGLTDLVNVLSKYSSWDKTLKVIATSIRWARPQKDTVSSVQQDSCYSTCSSKSIRRRKKGTCQV